MNKDFYQKHNILPPDTIKISKKKARDILVIDSKDRNIKLFPNPHQYTYDLLNQYRNVTEIELINAYIPNSKTRINNFNNELDISYNNQPKQTITFNPGNYWDDDNQTRKGENLINTNLKKYKFLYSSNQEEGLQVFYDFNCKKFIFYDKKNTDSGLGKTYTGPKKFTLHFQNPNQKRILYMGNENLVNDYISKSCGSFFGFKPENYSNSYSLLNTSKFDTKSKQLSLYFPDNDTLEKIVYLIKLGNKNLSFYFDGLDSLGNEQSTVFVNIGSSEVQIDNIDKNEKMLVLNTDTLYNKNGQELVEDITISVIYMPIVADYAINEHDDSYLLLKIPELDRFDSVDTTTQNSFALINMSNNSRVFENSNPGNIKYFNPPLAKLDRLSLNFCKHGGETVDFNGLNHCLVFSIEYLNQPYQIDF